MKSLQLLSLSNYIIINKQIAQEIGLYNAIILSYLCDLYQKFGNGFNITQDKLAKECCLSTTILKTRLKWLSDNNYLIIKKINNKESYYLTDDVVLLINKMIDNKVDINREKESFSNSRETLFPIDNLTIEKKKEDIDYSYILNKWREICPMLSQPRCITPKMKQQIRILLKNNEANINDLILCFKIIASSDFCINADGKNRNNWKAGFDWLIKDTKGCFNGLLDGKYSFKGNDKNSYEKIIHEENNIDHNKEININSNNNWEEI